MDPICHTLVGASLGATGLEKRTQYGRATLLVAANLPDIDVLAHLWGNAASFAFRRGLTHGLPALLVLPILLALLMSALSRIGSKPGARETSFRWLLALSAIGVATHPTLDWLNNYGMRWLMPVVDEWFYGDTLFIIDWVMWVGLSVGLVAAYRLGSRPLQWFQRPACWSLAFVLGYVAMNFTVTQLAEQATRESVSDNPPRRFMAAPVALNPFVRSIVLEYPNEYRFGEVRFSPGPRLEWHEETVLKGDPAVLERARAVREGRWFLHWARFPYSVVDNSGQRTVIRLADARYVRQIDNPDFGGFGVLALEVDSNGKEL